MDIKMKELEQKHKHDQENLQKLIETTAPSPTEFLHEFFEVAIQTSTPSYLQRKPIKTTFTIFQPPKSA